MTSADSLVLRSILDGLGWPEAGRGTINIIQDGKVLPTSMPIERITAGVLAALGTVIADIHAERNGTKPQNGSITTVAAGLAVDASTYLRVDGRDLKDKDRLTGFYRANDNHVFLHGNFPHLRAGLLDMFGAHDRESLAEAVARRSAMDIETEAAKRGLCAVAWRHRAEWERTSQARATAGLPLVEITRIGDAPAVALTPGPRPLSGIRALDLSRVIAGPMAGKTLAEHGAIVMLVTAPHLPAIEPLVIETGYGKLSSTLDLRLPGDTAILRNLVSSTDIFIDAYRPDALGAKGFGPEALARLRPGIVSVSLSAFSRAGEWAGRRGYDSLVQAAVGLAESDADGQPRRLPCQPLDYLTGYLASLGAIVALRRRAREGGSWHVSLSLERTATWIFEMADQLGRDKDVPASRPGLDVITPYLFDTPSAFGLVRHLHPVLVLSETPGAWSRAPVPLGSDLANWPTQD